MLFIDFMFDVLENGTILFDKDITLKQLHAEENNEYVVKLVDERVVFVKKGV